LVAFTSRRQPGVLSARLVRQAPGTRVTTAIRIKLKARFVRGPPERRWRWLLAIGSLPNLVRSRPAALDASSSTTAYSCDPWILNNGHEDLSNKGSQGLAQRSSRSFPAALHPGHHQRCTQPANVIVSSSRFVASARLLD
jgi:hypothetical protein